MQSAIKSLIMGGANSTAGVPANAHFPGKKALLVIDVQENLLKTESKWHMDPAAIPSFIRSLNKSITIFEENDLPVIYTVNEWTNPLLNRLSGNVCKKGAEGTGIDSRVVLVNDAIYSKSRMSALTNKKLSEFLIENSISELYITGLFAEACIKGTATAAAHENYKVFIIEDAIGSRNSMKKSRSVNYCKSKGATVIATDQLELYVNAGRFSLIS